MDHFIRFSSDQAGLERILRLIQSITQIILGVPLLALTATVWINRLPSTVAFFTPPPGVLGGKEASAPTPAPALQVADTLLLMADMRGKLGLVRRTIRLFWFLGSFQTAHRLYATAASAASLELWLDISSRSFNGLYLVLETATLPDAVGVPHLRIFGPELAALLNVEAQRFWFLALVCSAASGCLRLVATYGEAAVLASTAGFGDKVGASKAPAGDKENTAKAKAAALAAAAAERAARRRALLRKLIADMLDMAAPGTVVGWLRVDAGTVGTTMFVTTLLTGYEVWKRFA